MSTLVERVERDDPPRSVNVHLRNAMLRQAIQWHRDETATVREISRMWQAMVRDVLTTLPQSPANEEGNTLPLLPGLSRVRVNTVMDRVSLVVRGHLRQQTQHLRTKLPVFITGVLRQVPELMQKAVDRGIARAAIEGESSDIESRREWFVSFIETGRLIGQLMSSSESGEEQNLHHLSEAPSDYDLLRQSSPVFNSVPITQAAELIASPLGGAFFQDSFADLADDTLRSLKNALVAGLLRGDGVRPVATAVRGILGNKRWQAERIVRSEYVRVANQAALLTYMDNKDVLRGVGWASTLDKRTCIQCAKLDGQTWTDMSKAKRPVSSTHPNCRCTLFPIVKGASVLPGVEDTPGTRASFDGQVPDTVTYTDWFADQDAAFQKEVLGPTRYKLYATGKLTLGDFASRTGVKPVSKLKRGLRK